MRSFLLILVAAIALASCSNSTSTGKPESTLTQKDYEAFALKLDTAMNAGNSSFFTASINIRALLDSVTAQRKTRSGDDKAFMKGFETAFRQGIDGIGKEMVQVIENGGSYKLLRIYEKNGSYHALFRMNSLDGLNYHDLALGEVDGKIMINDIFIYLTGENLSATLGRLIDKGISGGEGNFDQEYIDGMQQVQEAQMLAGQGMHEDAYAVLQELPEDIRNDKSTQVLKLTIAVQLGDDAYLKALNEFEEKYPNDPSLNLILIDGFLMNEEYGKALLSINKLDSSVKDPYLDAYRANIYYLMEDLERAESYMLKTISNVKEADVAVYIALAAIYLEQARYRETVEVMEKLHTHFGLSKDEVAGFFADYESFTSSSEFEEWMEAKS